MHAVIASCLLLLSGQAQKLTSLPEGHRGAADKLTDEEMLQVSLHHPPSPPTTTSIRHHRPASAVASFLLTVITLREPTQQEGQEGFLIQPSSLPNTCMTIQLLISIWICPNGQSKVFVSAGSGASDGPSVSVSETRTAV